MPDVGGYKLARPLPRPLRREALRLDLLRCIGTVWYLRCDEGWKLPADPPLPLWRRIWEMLRFRRPFDDAESHEYWARRGGPPYRAESYAPEWLEGARAKLNAIASFLGPQDTLVEVGCGPGRNLELASESGRRAFGADFSLPQLQVARRVGLDVALATARRLPFGDRTVDWTLFASVLLHVPPPLTPVLREGFRVARQGLFLWEQSYPGTPLGGSRSPQPHVFFYDLAAEVRHASPGCVVHENVRQRILVVRWGR